MQLSLPDPPEGWTLLSLDLQVCCAWGSLSVFVALCLHRLICVWHLW